MSPRLALYFLGSPQLHLDNASITAERRKVVALLAYLAIEQGQHRRELLSTLLWPDYDQSKAFTNLRHALWEIQQSIGEGWLITDREKVGLNEGVDPSTPPSGSRQVWVDVREFESLLAKAHAEKNISLRIPLLVESTKLYRNHFMSGFSLKDAPNFNEWMFAKSEDLRGQFAGALTSLSEDYCALGQAEKAIPYARRLVALDLLNESAHRLLMNIYWQAGQHSAALKQYQICEEILRKELNLDPQPETYALYKQIRKGGLKPNVITSVDTEVADKELDEVGGLRTKSVKTKTERVEQLKEIARTYEQRGEWGKAIQFYEDLMQTDGENPWKILLENARHEQEMATLFEKGQQAISQDAILRRKGSGSSQHTVPAQSIRMGSLRSWVLIWLVVTSMAAFGTYYFYNQIRILLTEGLSSYARSVEVYNPHPDPADYFDSKGVPMRLIPAGEFAMGANSGQADEEPIHRVHLDAFYIDKYEVTNALYKSCVDSGVCDPPQNMASSTRSNYYGNQKFDNFPVIYVDWKMAITYCEWRGGRLPTEAQWEKAARGSDGRMFPSGNSLDATLANYENNFGDTTRAGSFRNGVSPYGVYDMAGNVWEWVADWYSVVYYQHSSFSNPLGPETGQYRLLRGGAWNSYKPFVRSVKRSMSVASSFSNIIGFRCARD